MRTFNKTLVAIEDNDLWFFSVIQNCWISIKGKLLPVNFIEEPQTLKQFIKEVEQTALNNGLQVYEIGPDINLHDALKEIIKPFLSN